MLQGIRGRTGHVTLESACASFATSWLHAVPPLDGLQRLAVLVRTLSTDNSSAGLQTSPPQPVPVPAAPTRILPNAAQAVKAHIDTGAQQIEELLQPVRMAAACWFVELPPMRLLYWLHQSLADDRVCASQSHSHPCYQSCHTLGQQQLMCLAHRLTAVCRYLRVHSHPSMPRSWAICSRCAILACCLTQK